MPQGSVARRGQRCRDQRERRPLGRGRHPWEGQARRRTRAGLPPGPRGAGTRRPSGQGAPQARPALRTPTPGRCVGQPAACRAPLASPGATGEEARQNGQGAPDTPRIAPLLGSAASRHLQPPSQAGAPRGLRGRAAHVGGRRRLAAGLPAQPCRAARAPQQSGIPKAPLPDPELECVQLCRLRLGEVRRPA